MKNAFLCRKVYTMYFSTLTEEQRKQSYDYIENFIAEQVSDWSVAPNTDVIEAEFSRRIKNMGKEEFSFLVFHSGYIPELYPHDSSQETLYSKLIESLVCEWAKRVGFTDSYLQTQKSNKEDVTIKIGNNIIVCDAKSFRLGRSQAAPNVKDTIKKQAYTTWLEQYNEDSRIGGLVTFPSLHDWKKGSEAYYYFTEGNPSIMLLFYEQMAFILQKDIKQNKIIDFLNSYSEIYPKADKNKDIYTNVLLYNLFEDYKTEYKTFITETEKYIIERVQNTYDRLDTFLNDNYQRIKEEVEKISYEELKEHATVAKFNEMFGQLRKQQQNIVEFRPLMEEEENEEEE